MRDQKRSSGSSAEFLIQLMDALRPLEDPGAVRAVATRLLGEYLETDVMNYFEVDETGKYFLIPSSHARGDAASMVGRYPIAEFPATAEALFTRPAVIISDMTATDVLPPAECVRLAALQIRSFVAVPISRQGQFVASFAAVQSAPRCWNSEEVSLMLEAAERTRDLVLRAKAHVQLQENAERQGFLLRLSDLLQDVEDAGSIATATTEALGSYLGIGRCGYGEMDAAGENLHFLSYWGDGTMPEMPKTARLLDFGDEIADTLNSGGMVVVEDTLAAEHSAGVVEAFEKAGEVRAAAGLALIRGGRPVAFLFVNHSKPRYWTANELALIREVAERTWDTIQRFRAEEALRKSEARYRMLFVCMTRVSASSRSSTMKRINR